MGSDITYDVPGPYSQWRHWTNNNRRTKYLCENSRNHLGSYSSGKQTRRRLHQKVELDLGHFACPNLAYSTAAIERKLPNSPLLPWERKKKGEHLCLRDWILSHLTWSTRRRGRMVWMPVVDHWTQKWAQRCIRTAGNL